MADVYVIERGSPSDKIEITADRAEQDTASSRVTFYTGAGATEKTVGSFINVSSWYVKPAAAN